MKKLFTLLLAMLAVVGVKAASYTETLTTIPPEDAGIEFGSVESTVDVTDNGDGTYDFTLNNWVYLQNNYPMGLGKFTVSGLAGTTVNGVTTIEGTKTTSFENGDYPGVYYWAASTLKDIPVTVKASFDADNMYAVISADGSETYFNTVYNATFGEDIFPDTPVGGQTLSFTETLTTIAPEDAGIEFDPGTATADVVDNGDGTYDFTLNNWYYGMYGSMKIGVGTFTMTGLSGTTVDGITTIKGEQTVTFTKGDASGVSMWVSSYLVDIPVTLTATFDSEHMYAVIKADASENYPYNVYNAVFGEDIFPDTPVGGQTLSFTETLTTIAPEDAGIEFDPGTATADVVDNGDGTYDFTLNNWYYGMYGSMKIGVGTFTMTGLSGTTVDGVTTIKGEQTVTFTKGDVSGVSMWVSGYLVDIPVTLTATFDNEHMYAVIKADASENYPYNVYNAVFGEDIFPDTPVGGQTLSFTETLTTIAPEDAGIEFDPGTATADVVDNGDGTYDFTLNNWYYGMYGSMKIGVGTFTMTGLSGTTVDGITTIKGEQTVTFTQGDAPGVSMWVSGYLVDIPVTLTATFDSEHMYAVIKADASENYPYNVYNAVFGEDIFGGNTPSEETIYFYFQDGEEDDFDIEQPWSLVAIWNESAGEWGEPVAVTGAYMPYEFTAPVTLRIYPDDLDYEVVVSVENETENDYVFLYKEDTNWYLELLDVVSPLEVYVKVYLAGMAPGNGEASDVETSFIVNAASGSGIENPEQYVNITYFDRETFTDVTVDGTTTVSAGTTFTVTPAEGYMISDISTWSAGVAEISEPSVPTDAWQIYIVEQPKDMFASFFVTVAKAPEKITFYFQDGEEDDFEIEYPWNYVMIWNETSEEPVAVGGEAMMNYYPQGETTLRIYPEDLDYELVVSVENDTEDDVFYLYKEETNWYLELVDVVSPLEVYVKVYLAGKAPGNEPESVTMNFNVTAAENNDISDPGSCVAISYFDKETFTTETLTVSDNFATATVMAGTSFDIAPMDGYEITDIYSFSAGVAEISEPMEGENVWNVYVLDSPRDISGYFFIEVAKKTSGVEGVEATEGNVEIFNMQGIRVNGGELAPGMYIMNGKKVMIRK